MKFENRPMNVLEWLVLVLLVTAILVWQVAAHRSSTAPIAPTSAVSSQIR